MKLTMNNISPKYLCKVVSIYRLFGLFCLFIYLLTVVDSYLDIHLSTKSEEW